MDNFSQIIKGKRAITLGFRRLVYDLGNGKVLKIAKSISGVKSNKTEVKMYSSCPYPIKKHLAKIIKYGNDYSWLIMKRYNQIVPESAEYEQMFFELRSKFKKNGIIPYDIATRYGKPNYKNIRLKPDGEIVVIDFGDFKFRSKVKNRRGNLK
jgi:hypothetical protein